MKIGLSLLAASLAAVAIYRAKRKHPSDTLGAEFPPWDNPWGRR